MRNHRPSALGSAERSPFKDLTNTPTNETANQASEKPKSGANWYARMSDEKRAEYNQKRRMARADKKAASAIGIDHEDVSEPHAPSSLDVPRTPLSNITNSNVQAGEKTKSGKNWYARLSDEKRAEYNQKRRMARADNKAASVITIGHEEFSRTHASSSLDVPRTPLSNITSLNVTAATSADTDHQFGDAALGRRKRSSDEEKAEHCKKLRIARLEKRAATTSVQVTPGTAHSGSSMQTDGQIDWLHTNPTYERQQMNVHEVVDMSVSEGRHRQESFLPGSNSLRSVQVTEVSSAKKRRRMREQYHGMTPEEKEVVLHRKRAYKMGKRHASSEQSNLAEPACGSAAPSPSGVHPGCQNNGEDSDDAGILEPMDPSAEVDECLHDIQHGQPMYDDDDDGDDECRIFTGQGHEFESYRLTPNVSHAFESDDPYDYVYKNLPTKHHVLKPVKDCVHCGAIRFQYEGPAFCCRKGKVKVCIPEVPQELQRLFSNQVDEDAKYFRQHIRYFNSHFSFASLGVTLDQRVNTAARTGIYTFRAHGQLYHRLDHLVPGDHGPRHLQLYIYDTDEALEHRVKRSPDLDINLIRKILRILEINPYVETFKSLGSVPDLAEYKITLNTNIKLDQRRYNAPTASQVAAMWVEGSDPQHTFDRSVVVHAKGDRPLYIRAYYGCYDPLAYPLFYPAGETGWNRWLPYEGPTPTQAGNDDEDDNQDDEREEDDNEEQDEDEATESRKYVSAREYYCFKLQIREGIFNILLFGGRLLQQWLVDMYIKMETMRLDFYSKPQNQKLIRAELYQVHFSLIIASHTGTNLGDWSFLDTCCDTKNWS